MPSPRMVELYVSSYKGLFYKPAPGLSDESRLAELRHLIAQGATLSDLRFYWGISRQAAAKRLRKLGLKTINPVGRRPNSQRPAAQPRQHQP